MNSPEYMTNRGQQPYSALKTTMFNRNFFAFAISLIVMIFLLTIIYFESQLRREIESEVYESLNRLTNHSKSVLLEHLDRHRRNVFFLHDTPPIKGLTRALANDGVDPLDGTRFDQWQNRLETIFAAMLRSNPEIDQLRVISTQTAGRELIRVDRAGGSINIAPESDLQDKGQTDYYLAASSLNPNEYYVSLISLNREYGEIEFPFRPTKRIAVPIFYENGERFGFLIVNINASVYIQAFRDAMDGQFQAILTDSEGFFIEHPDESFRFSRDLNPQYSWSDYSISALTPLGSYGRATDPATGSTYYFRSTSMNYGPGENSYNYLIVTTSTEYASSLMQERRASLYSFMSIVFLALIFILLILRKNVFNSMKLANTRAEYEAIINHSRDAIIGLSLSGLVTSWNRAAGELFNLSEKDTIGKGLSSLNILAPLKIEREIDRIFNGEDVGPLEYNHKSIGNKVRNLTLNFSPIQYGNAYLSGVALIVRDVTAQKSAEKSILQINSELEKQVAERTHELQKAHQTAIQASEYKSTFISNVSHEMRTPLNGMIGTINLLKRFPLTVEQKKYIAMAETSTRSLSSLINDVLDLSKIEAGKLDFESKPFDPIALIEATAESTAIRAHEKYLEFIVDVSGIEHSRLYGDANRIKQILNNLIGNAIKFTEKGEVSVQAKTQLTKHRRIKLSVSISDTGIGIEKKNQDKLFQAFTQADRNISGNFGGTGLGLSICKQLCQLMGGDISLDSTFGKGSTFYFEVYFDAQDSEVDRPLPLLKGKVISLAITNFSMFCAIQNMLVKYGMEAKQSWQSSSQYLEAISSTASFDFVITDYTDNALFSLLGHFHDEDNQNIILLKSTTTQQREEIDSLKVLSKPVATNSLLRAILPEHTFKVDSDISSSPETSPIEKLIDATVLVVDDNDINLEVACGLLEPLGLEFRTAHNGQQAIDVLIQSNQNGAPIQCVLMDCQMPVMNGYDCTRRIREGDAGSIYRNIPIIAMTANAMSGEREACLEAGMSDYITKPLSFKHLLEKVSRWVGDYKRSTSSDSKQSQSLVEDAESLATWDPELSLSRFLGNKALLERICRMFLDSAEEHFKQLEKDTESMNYKAIKSTSHRMKGICGDIGAVRIHHYFSLLELAADKEERTEIKTLFQLTRVELPHVIAALETYLR